MGQALGQQDQPLEALASLEEAAKLLRGIVDQAPAVPRYRLDLGKCLREAGRLLTQANRSDEAIERLEASQTMLSHLVKEAPSNVTFTTELQEANDELARAMAASQATPRQETTE